MEPKQILFVDKDETVSIDINGHAIDQINAAIEYMVEQYGGKEKFFVFAKDVIENKGTPKPGLETHICSLSTLIALYEQSALVSNKVKTRTIDDNGELGEITDFKLDKDINEN